MQTRSHTSNARPYRVDLVRGREHEPGPPSAAFEPAPPIRALNVTYHFPETKPCLVDISLSFSVASRWTWGNDVRERANDIYRCRGRHITSSRNSFLLLRPFFLFERIGIESSFYLHHTVRVSLPSL